MIDDLKYIHDHDSVDALGRAAKRWPALALNWLPTVPAWKNYAKQLALDCIGKRLVIYSGPELAAAAGAWEASFRAVAGRQARAVVLPKAELPMEAPAEHGKAYAVIMLRSGFEDTEVAACFAALESELAGSWTLPVVIQAAGDNLEAQQQWCTALGDFVTIYTALLSGLDPSANRLT
ncbi:MAG: bifunctional phosphoglucose/phosphomannose isomerase [Candidatus Saccharibacteria bacterium]|nr:bifunctional phosphoglucose/phosphomannose isomerase [Candidatus Saccharibacteria bacterium]